MADEKSSVEVWLSHANEIISFVIEPPMAGAEARCPPSHVDAARVLMFHWARAFRTFKALVILVQAGHSEDAVSLLRTLVENLFESAFIAKFPADAELYISYGLQTQAHRLRTLRERIDPDKNPDLYFSAGLQEAKVLAQSPEGSRKPIKGIHSGWHPKYKSVKERAAVSGLPPYYYDIIYRFSSRYIHGSSDWMVEFLSSGKNKRISYNGDSGEAALATSHACMCIVEMLQILDGCLSLSLGEKLTHLLAAHQKLIDSEYDQLERDYNTGISSSSEA